MARLKCGLCGRSDYMDLPNFMGDTDRVIGVQLCAYCAEGPKNLIRQTGKTRSGGGRGKNGTMGRRIIYKEELEPEKYQLWVLEWMAYKLNEMANHMNRVRRAETHQD